jgi:tyrosine-specific transport protein
VLHRAVTAVLVFAPPVTAALLSPGRFIQALAHAGAALTILAVFLPCAMAWKLRRDNVQASYQVAGGTAALVVTSAFGLLVVSASYL